MNTFFRFFYEFISIFFGGLFSIVKGLFNGIVQMVSFKDYKQIIDSYKGNFNGPEWLFVGIAVGSLVIIAALIILLLFFLIRKIIKFRKTKVDQEDLLDEIGHLNNQVRDLMEEKKKIMAMKVSQLGLKPEDDPEGGEEENPEDKDKEKGDPNVRFAKLDRIDNELADFKPKDYANNFTLEECIDNFKCFAASKLHLYYHEDLLRPFFAGLACGKLIILQGISGTGKTSLAYAWGKFVNHDSCVAPVMPSWRDKTELLGYFNEFTKKFNETGVLEELYLAKHDDDVHTIILDEMNIARVEYYFAEFLSILEMPDRNEWIVELVTSSWPQDPKRLDHGKIQLPVNLWFIGTINNDDSTFMVSDKVYDRAMPIDINTKVDPFKCREQEAISINSSYLESLFVKASEELPMDPKNIEKIKLTDDYVISHFRIAFGNRIMRQFNTFVPVYKACGGKEVLGIDYFLAKKILRKFDQLNIALIRDEIDPFISFLNKQFGKGAMRECIEYLERLKKSM